MHVQMDAMKADALKLQVITLDIPTTYFSIIEDILYSQAEISEHKSAALRAQQDVEAAKRDRVSGTVSLRTVVGH